MSRQTKRLPKELFVADNNPGTEDQYFSANEKMEDTYAAHDEDTVTMGIYELKGTIRVSRKLEVKRKS